MKLTHFFSFFAAALALAAASAAHADTLTLKNGDRLTGTIEASDGKDVTFKTDYAGEIKISWSAVQDVKSDKPIYVVLPDKTTVSGNLSTDNANLVVRKSDGTAAQVPLATATVLRSSDQQTAYEKSLHPPLLSGWNGGVNLGFALARGNSETTNLNTGISADRKTLNDEITLTLASLYTTDDAPGGGVTANSILGNAKYDRNITKRLFGFGSGDFTHDQLQGLSLRQIYTGGLGVHVIGTPNTTLDFLLGVNYTRESYTSGTMAAVRVNRNLPGITVGENFTHKFGKSTTVTEIFDFYPDLSDLSQYRFSLDAASVTKINKWLGWQNSLSDRYVTDPPIAGTKTNDVIFSTGVNLSFTH